MSPDALVLGAGIAGLTAAIRLAEDGWRVHILTDRDPLDTTSATAAAIWLPYAAAPVDRVLAWAHGTYDVLLADAADPASGVRLAEGRICWCSAPDPTLARLPASARPPRPLDTVPAGLTAGVALALPVIEMPRHLRWLVARLGPLGVAIEQRHVGTLGELAGAAPLLVNATGLGARDVAGDDSVFPIRGQIVRVENPGIREFTLDEDTPDGVRYVIPRSHDVVVGGTSEPGKWDVTPDPAVRARLLARAIQVEPRLAGARVLADRVGLRPGRPSVRVEAERWRDGTVVIHDYGHGGSGVTIGWGCAAEVAALARAAAQ